MNSAKLVDLLLDMRRKLPVVDNKTLSDHLLQVVEPMGIISGLILKEVARLTGISVSVKVTSWLEAGANQVLIGNALLVSPTTFTLLKNPDIDQDTFDKLSIMVLPCQKALPLQFFSADSPDLRSPTTI